MRNIITFIFCIASTFQLFSQIPDLQIQDTLGSSYNLPDYLENDRNYALIFWSAQDAPSTAALNDYHNHFNDWMSNNNLEFVIVSIDEENIHDGVIDYVNQQGWRYHLFFSPAAEVAQAFGVNQIPYIYLINMDHEIVFEVAGWMQGDLLGQEIAQLFPVGLKEYKAFDNWKVYAIDNNIIVDADKFPPSLRISVFTMDGKLQLQYYYKNQISNQIKIGASSLPIGTMAIVKIEANNSHIATRKIMVK